MQFHIDNKKPQEEKSYNIIVCEKKKNRIHDEDNGREN